MYEVWFYEEGDMFAIKKHSKLAEDIPKHMALRMTRDAQLREDGTYCHLMLTGRPASEINIYIRGAGEPTYALTVNGVITRYMFDADKRDRCRELMEGLSARGLDLVWSIDEIDHSRHRMQH